MFVARFTSLAAASLLLVRSLSAADTADAVLAYTPGTGYATDFSTGAGFTNAASALGLPSTVTPGPFGGPVDPFNPAYLGSQLVSLGAGGSLVLQFATPVANAPDHPYGVDFSLFGNAGFVITNGDYSGGGITDGSTFGHNAAGMRVSVSADGVNFFTLNSPAAGTGDGPLPTDGLGDFSVSLNPNLRATDFAGKALTGIRSLYGGAAGGVGYDIGWAVDANGVSVALDRISAVRVDVLSGHAEIDGVVAVVPEPATWLIGGVGAVALLGWRRRMSRLA